VVHQGRAVGSTHQVAERIDVGHPAGHPQLDGPLVVGAAVVVEPGEATVRVARGSSEVEQPVTLGLEPAAVGRRRQPRHAGIVQGAVSVTDSIVQHGSRARA
jgi:hypothetical protein